MISRNSLENFLIESNEIEDINLLPTDNQIGLSMAFLKLETVYIKDLTNFVNLFQSDAVIRNKKNLNVRVGPHIAPPGGNKIVTDLQNLLWRIKETTPFEFHCGYETLHPFTDCNGRSGRILWLWQMVRIFPNMDETEFLHQFYYQTLQETREASE